MSALSCRLFCLAAAVCLLSCTAASAQTPCNPKLPPSVNGNTTLTGVDLKTPCRVQLVAPAQEQKSVDSPPVLYRVTLQTKTPRTQFWVKHTAAARTPWDRAVHGPDERFLIVESTMVAVRHEFQFWDFPAGELEIRRQDLGPDTAAIQLDIAPITVSTPEFGDGYGARVTVEEAVYRKLVEYAGCARGGAEETPCLEQLATTAQWQQSLQPSDWTFKSKKDRITAFLHFVMSRWMGRNPVTEFARPHGGGIGRRASQSEPVVLFVGLSGVNRFLMLDCHGLTEQNAIRRCDDYAKPSARSLERADYFWAMYVEDEDVPFDTSIDLEFTRNARDADYDEFDPRVPPQPALGTQTQRVLKIGWKRFQLPEAPLEVQVAFSRQGPSYGLRQWTRVFTQRSKTWLLPAAAIFIPVTPPSKLNASLQPVYPDGEITAAAHEIVETRKRRGVFATVSVQWPQWRAKADDAGPIRRLAINLVPDVTAGMAEDDLYFMGGSWPMPLWRDRSYATVGMLAKKEIRPLDGFQIGQRVPTTLSSIFEERWRWSFAAGLSIEIIKLRR